MLWAVLRASRAFIRAVVSSSVSIASFRIVACVIISKVSICASWIVSAMLSRDKSMRCSCSVWSRVGNV